MQRRPGWVDMLNKNKFHAGLLNPRCNRSSHSGACECVLARMHVHVRICVYLCIAAPASRGSSVWSEWVRMKLKNKPKKKKKKRDELQSIGAGSPY